MPRKDPDARREYSREWYARPENRERTIQKVAARKHTAYAGVCRNCGGPTVGQSAAKIPEWCGDPACKREQAKERFRLYGADQHRTRAKRPKKEKESGDAQA